MSKWMTNLYRLTRHYNKILNLRPKGIESSVWKDYTHWHNHGTIVNATEIGTPAGTGFYFDDTSYINCGNNASLDITGAITIEAWVKPAVTDKNQNIFRKTESLAINGYIVLLRSDNKISYFTNQVATSQTTYTTLGLITQDKWQHIVLVRNGTTATFYRNAIDITDVHGTHIDPTPSGQTAYIGKSGTKYPFNGIIDEVRIYADALTAADILTLYNLGKRQRSL